MVHESRLFSFEMEPYYVIQVNFELMGSKIFLPQLGLQANATIPSHEQRMLQNVFTGWGLYGSVAENAGLLCERPSVQFLELENKLFFITLLLIQWNKKYLKLKEGKKWKTKEKASHGGPCTDPSVRERKILSFRPIHATWQDPASKKKQTKNESNKKVRPGT